LLTLLQIALFYLQMVNKVSVFILFFLPNKVRSVLGGGFAALAVSFGVVGCLQSPEVAWTWLEQHPCKR
jgi:hypothetical protein